MRQGEIPIEYHPRRHGRAAVERQFIEAEIYGAFAAHPCVRFVAGGALVAGHESGGWQVTHATIGRYVGPVFPAATAREVARRLSAIPGVDALTTAAEWEDDGGAALLHDIAGIIRDFSPSFDVLSLAPVRGE